MGFNPFSWEDAIGGKIMGDWVTVGELIDFLSSIDKDKGVYVETKNDVIRIEKTNIKLIADKIIFDVCDNES